MTQTAQPPVNGAQEERPPEDGAALMHRILPYARHEETHLSHIFITQSDVFKLKKPVRLPFADFSTVAKRKAACEREIEVNQALAAELYRGLIPLGIGLAGPALGEEAHIADWLVHMHPFPAGDRFDRRLAAGRAGTDELLDLVTRLCAFYGQAVHTPDPYWSRRIRALIVNAEDGLRTTVKGRELMTAIAEWRATALERTEEMTGLLTARGERGLAEGCHGDLHLKNICYWQGRLLPYDALEFDAELTRIDPYYDLCFLLMDLWHAGHHQEANLVMNRYMSQADDYAAAPLSPIYQSLRAAIRSMACAMSGQPKLRDGYLASASEFLMTQQKAKVIAIAGRSGTGKSTVARLLAPRLGEAPGAIILRSDVLRKRHFSVSPETPLPPQGYSEEVTEAVYRRIVDIARGIAPDWPLILDATFTGTGGAQDDAGALTTARFWLTAPEETLKERLQRRTGDASDADTAVMRSQTDQAPGTDWQLIDAARPAHAVADDIAARLGL